MNKKNVLIIGAGNYARFIINELKLYKGYRIAGIIDDNKDLTECNLEGVRIVGSSYDIPIICKKYNIDLILVGISNLDEINKKRIVNICKETNLDIKIMPNIEWLLKNSINSRRLEDIDLNKLLKRPLLKVDEMEISKCVEGKVVLVTGGGGSIGSELCRQISDMNPKKIIIIDIYENTTYELKNELNKKYPQKDIDVIITSVLERERIENIFRENKPDIVFHAAAYKHVPFMEDSPYEAIKNNIIGTLNIAEISHFNKVSKFVLISTDKAVNPTNVMGATKRFCEMIITSINSISDTSFSAVRFGNVLGSNGSVIPTFKKQVQEGGPVTVTHKDISRYFMLIPEAVRLVLQASVISDGGEVFVLDMGNPVKIYDLAKQIICMYGLKPDIDIDIKIVGLRPGEKLYEELIINKDNMEFTSHKMIMRELCEIHDFNFIKECINDLKGINLEIDSDIEIKEKLKSVVGTYSIQNII